MDRTKAVLDLVQFYTSLVGYQFNLYLKMFVSFIQTLQMYKTQCDIY